MKFKLLLNMLQGIHADALGETLKIAKENNMDMSVVGEALCERPGGVITNLVWQSYQKEPDPINFSVRWITKDLEYAKKLAEGIDTPLLNDTLKKYHEAIKKDLGSKDFTIIAKL
jgi:3-hydroxyisobutyrate dehydrogenase